MATALVIGASRGIGLGLVEAFMRRGWRAVGTVRGTAGERAIAALDVPAGGSAGVEWVDIRDATQVRALRDRVADRNIDALFVNAGVFGPHDSSLEEFGNADVGDVFLTNAVATVRAAQILQPCVAADGVIAFSSSSVGSVGLNRACDKRDLDLYRASKAAMNALIRVFAERMPQSLAVMALSPGLVRTDMTGPHALLDVATSAGNLVRQVEAARGTGRRCFMSHDGVEIPW